MRSFSSIRPSGRVLFKEQADPSVPSSGTVLYGAADGLRTLDPAGVPDVLADGATPNTVYGQYSPEACGLKGWSQDPDVVAELSTGPAALTAGSLYLMRLNCIPGVLSGLAVPIQAANSGVTSAYVGLYNLSLSRVASSDDVKALFTSMPSVGWAQAPFASTVNNTVNTDYFAAIIFNGSPPTLIKSQDVGLGYHPNFGCWWTPWRTSRIDGNSTFPASFTWSSAVQLSHTVLLAVY